jgi:hypothetical protein
MGSESIRAALVCALITAVAGQPAAGQVTVFSNPRQPPPCTLPVDKAGQPKLPESLERVTYEIPRLSAVELMQLRSALNKGYFNTALNIYYHCVRAEHYLDWVIYVDTAGAVTQALLNGADSVQGIVRQSRYIWIVVFSELAPARVVPVPTATTPAANLPRAGFRFSRRTVAVKPDPVLTSLLNAVGALVKTGPLTTTNAPRADSAIVIVPDTIAVLVEQQSTKKDSVVVTRHIRDTNTVRERTFPVVIAGRLDSVVTVSTTITQSAGGVDSTPAVPESRREIVTFKVLDKLFVASGRFGLDDDTEAAFSMSLDSGVAYPVINGPSWFHGASAQFDNAGRSAIEVSIGLGATYARTPTLSYSKNDDDSYSVSSNSPRGLSPSLFLVTTFNLKRPQFPRHPRAVGLSIATNLVPGTLLDDIVVGLTASRIPFFLWRNLGLTVGATWQRRSIVDDAGVTQNSRVIRPAVIVDVRM